MSQDVFNKLIEQFGELEFDGTAQLFYLGEPLLDKTMPDKIRQFRAACPRSKILITSNGDLLKQTDQVSALFDAGLNVLNVDAYDTDVYERVLNIMSNCDEDVETSYGKVEWRAPSHRSKLFTLVDVTDPEISRHAVCHTYLIPEIERALKENGMILPKKQRYCAQPHRRLVVWWTGQIVLCCVTTPVSPSPTVVGDYRDVLAAWNSETMQAYRWHLQHGRKVGQCKDCYYKHAFPHVVRRIEKPKNAEEIS
jgi:MoaA/NifB/PqqE/SkfB family radical SAM enzyme